MTKNLYKDFLREIKSSANRFLSILLIVAIGVSCFVGLKSAAPDMMYTMDSYFDDYNIMDIQVISTLGLTEDDLDALAGVEGVKEVQGGYLADALTTIDGGEYVFRIHSIPQAYQNGDTTTINQFNIVEGRMPEADNEILLERSNNVTLDVEIGDQLTFTSGTATALTDESDGSMNYDTFTVVGFAETPYYLTYDKGTSQISGKSLNLFAYVPENAFAYKDKGIFIEALITVDGAIDLNSFKAKYKNLVGSVTDEITNIGVDRAQIRSDQLREDATAQLNEAQETYDTELANFNEQIADGQQQLDDAYTQLIQGEDELTSEKEKFEIQVEDAQEQLDAAAEELASGREQLAYYQDQYNSAKEQYDSAMEQTSSLRSTANELNDLMGDLDSAMGDLGASIADMQNDPDSDASTIANAQSLYSSYQSMYSQAHSSYSEINGSISAMNSSIDQIEDTLNSTGAKLNEYQAQLEEGQAEYDAGVQQLADAKVQAEEQFAAAEEELESGWEEYNTALADFEAQKADGEAQLEDGKEQLIDAKYQIELMDNASWYVLDRMSNYGYVSYNSTVTSMNALAQLIPVFFILVAILVCMTTMTRMVSEQRTNIGTYKALGYANNAIASKYVMYVSAASVIGTICGSIFGELLFPRAVYSAWAAMYVQPAFKQTPHIMIVILAIILAVLIMAATAYYTCYSELASVPAELMRPKAPKLGKTILMEKIPFIWNHLNFSQKVTARNIFRYKKRMFMTIIGIMGCSALLLAGLGMNDTITKVVDNQYVKVFSYNLNISLDEDISDQDRAAVEDLLAQRSDIVGEYTYLTASSFTIGYNGVQESASAYVAENSEALDGYILLDSRASGKKLTLDDESIIISEKMANSLGIQVGDVVDVINSDNMTKKLTVSGITENYVFHYVYMTNACYEDNFWYAPSNNTILMNAVDGASQDDINAFVNQLQELDGVSSVVNYADLAASFGDQMSAMQSIVILIIICAALLAFVVLYNLININISERIREIATIKVLGFKNKEVALYVYRESFILAIIGALIGLILGVVLHRVIISSIEQDYFMFGYVINPLSYVLAVVLAIVFTLLVMVYMYHKLNNIPMVESLKTVE